MALESVSSHDINIRECFPPFHFLQILFQTLLARISQVKGKEQACAHFHLIVYFTGLCFFRGISFQVVYFSTRSPTRGEEQRPPALSLG